MIFNEATHEYIHDNELYISTTQLLKKYGLSADYAGIPDAVLEKAATKGRSVHKALELYIGGDQSMLGLVNEVDLFANYITLRNIDLTKAKSEQIVFDTTYKIAGTVDFQYEDGGDQIIADFKTTSSLHIDAVAWQLSIYNYLITQGDILKYYFNKLKVFHMVNGKLYVRDVYTVEYDAVKALLDANLLGLPVFDYVKPNNIMAPSEELLITQILNELGTYEAAVKKLQSELDKELDKVKNNLIKQKTYSYKTADFSITYLHPQHRRSLDPKKVKEFLVNNNQVVDDYMKEIVTKDGIKISLNKNNTGDIDGD